MCEVNEATTVIIKLVQVTSFQNKVLNLKELRQIQTNSPLLRLRPFLNETGVLRVLKNSSVIDVCQRHPVVLPAKSAFTHLIFLNEHILLMHVGPQTVLSSVRLKYWPLIGRNIARKVAHRCVQCFKYRPVVTRPIMGDLPKTRVEPAQAFLKTGVDFAGPFYVKTSLRHNAPLIQLFMQQ